MGDWTQGHVWAVSLTAVKLQGRLARFWEENILQFLREVIIAPHQHAFLTSCAPLSIIIWHCTLLHTAEYIRITLVMILNWTQTPRRCRLYQMDHAASLLISCCAWNQFLPILWYTWQDQLDKSMSYPKDKHRTGCPKKRAIPISLKFMSGFEINFFLYQLYLSLSKAHS